MVPEQAATLGKAGVSALPEGDPAFGQVVGCQLHGHGVAPEDPDVMLAHFPGDVGDDFMPVLKLYPELGIGEGFDYRALHFDAFFFRHKACPESENAECNQDRSWIQTITVLQYLYLFHA